MNGVAITREQSSDSRLESPSELAPFMDADDEEDEVLSSINFSSLAVATLSSTDEDKGDEFKDNVPAGGG